MADSAPLTRLAAGNPPDDARIGRVLDEHSHFELSPCTNREEWLQRATICAGGSSAAAACGPCRRGSR